ANARTAFDALSGEAHVSFRHAAAQASDLFQTTLTRRAGLGADPGTAQRVTGGALFWGALMGESGDVNADGNAEQLQHRFAGLAFGAEGGGAAAGGTFTGGAAFGFLDGRASVDDR